MSVSPLLDRYGRSVQVRERGQPLASPILNRLGHQIGRPVAPQWFVDAVEVWAREWGRHARTTWDIPVHCFVTRFQRRFGDPVLEAVMEGRVKDEGEPFYWHRWSNEPLKKSAFGVMRPGWVPMDIEAMGTTGVRQALNQANLWGGRGEYTSFEDLADKVTASNDNLTEAKRAQLKDGLRDPLRSTIRKAKGNAFVGGS